MSATAKVILGVLACVMGALWLLYQVTIGGIADQRAMARLDRVNLFNTLGLPVAEVDTIVFEDGDDGWFVIADPGAVATADIGFYGSRLTGEIFGLDHVPIYCSGSGKIIWAVSDNRTRGALAYCRKRRMDLAALRPFAAAARIEDFGLNRPDILALREEISADDRLFGVSLPGSFEPFDYSFTMQTPYQWYSWDDPSTPHLDAEEKIREAVRDAFPDFDDQFTLTVRRNNVPELTDFVPNAAGDGFVPGETGPVLERDGKLYILTQVDWIERYEVTFGCAQTVCDQLATLQLSDLIPPAYRDASRLDGVFDTAVEMTSREPSPESATLDLIMDDTVHVGSIVENIYAVRIARLK